MVESAQYHFLEMLHDDPLKLVSDWCSNGPSAASFSACSNFSASNSSWVDATTQSEAVENNHASKKPWKSAGFGVSDSWINSLDSVRGVFFSSDADYVTDSGTDSAHDAALESAEQKHPLERDFFCDSLGEKKKFEVSRVGTRERSCASAPIYLPGAVCQPEPYHSNQIGDTKAKHSKNFSSLGCPLCSNQTILSSQMDARSAR